MNVFIKIFANEGFVHDLATHGSVCGYGPYSRDIQAGTA